MDHQAVGGATPDTGRELGDAIRARCQELAAGVTSLHPLAGRMGDASAKGEILKALFEITRQIEVIKKQTQRSERRDESRLL